MDKPLNGGFVCEKHGIGYIGKCPSCTFQEQSHKLSKKEQKAFRQMLRKSKR